MTPYQIQIPPSRIRGFTLLELIVAIAVFSVMSVSAYTGLRNFMTTQSGLEQREKEFAAIQTAVSLIEQDLTNLVGRTVRDEYGDKLPALNATGGPGIELTRQRIGVPVEFAAVDLSRIDYYIADNDLWRRTWNVLDRVSDSDFQERLVLSGVSELSWRFMSERWLTFWPQAADPFSARQLPFAVEMVLHLADGRSIDRVILIPNRG